MRFLGAHLKRPGEWHVRICGDSTHSSHHENHSLIPAASEDSQSSGTAEAGSHDGDVLEGIDVVI